MTQERRGKLTNTKSIHHRPQDVNRRSRYGDCQVDLIVGANHKGGLLTLNDRKTCIVRIRKIESKNSKYIAKLMVSIFKKTKGEYIP